MDDMMILQGKAQLSSLETASNAELMAALNNVTMLLRMTNERMSSLEAEVKRLTKVTPSQASELNRAIRTRAKMICEKHRAVGCEKAMASAIRAAVKNTCGISTARELPRCDFSVAMRQVEIWDDFKKIREIKAKEAARNVGEQDGIYANRRRD